jgi:hypothetical protein
MKNQERRRSDRWRGFGWFYLLWLTLLLLMAVALTPSSAWADDCSRDPTNLQDCMRTGGFRQVLTIIAVLLGQTPVWVAQRMGVTPEEINRLINRDGWAPEWERIKLIDWWRSGRGGPLPKFPDLSGEILSPGRTSVERIYDGKRAKKILRNLNILKDLRRLDPNDPQKQQKLEMMTHNVKAHRRVKAIAFDWKWVPGPDGKPVQVVDTDNVVIVVEEPEYKLPKPPPPPKPGPKPKPKPGPKPKPKPGPKPKPKPGPKPGKPAPPPIPPAPPGPKPGKPPKKPAPTAEPKRPGIEDLHDQNRDKFKHCQDLPWARLHDRPPPSPGSITKREVFNKLIDEGYRFEPEHVVHDPADAAKIPIKDGDILMFDFDVPVDVVDAAHYAVVEGGKIYHVPTLPQPDQGQIETLDRSQLDWFFRRRAIVGDNSGKVYRPDKVYKHLLIFRKKR